MRTDIVAILSLFVVAPAIVFSFILLAKRARYKVDELRYKRDILALEVEKERARVAAFEAENRKYDRLIADEERK